MAKSLGAYVTIRVKIKKLVSTDELNRPHVDLVKFAKDELDTIEFCHEANLIGKIKGKNYEIVGLELEEHNERI